MKLTIGFPCTVFNTIDLYELRVKCKQITTMNLQYRLWVIQRSEYPIKFLPSASTKCIRVSIWLNKIILYFYFCPLIWYRRIDIFDELIKIYNRLSGVHCAVMIFNTFSHRLSSRTDYQNGINTSVASCVKRIIHIFVDVCFPWCSRRATQVLLNSILFFWGGGLDSCCSGATRVSYP